MNKHYFSVQGKHIYLNGRQFLARGLRCSNALYSNESTKDLINNLDLYNYHGINTISVYFMGNRFSDFTGYNEDGSLKSEYKERMGNIIEAADERGMLVIVGCLYWGQTKAKYQGWKQKEANAAIKNTVLWLSEKNYFNCLIDVDNEGMAQSMAGFDDRELVLAGKSANPKILIATNYSGLPPQEADLGLHFSEINPENPYIESEGTPHWAPGGYWGRWSRKFDSINSYKRDDTYWNYINIGVYTEEMKRDCLEMSKKYFDNGWGYLLASTWLQAVPPFGPNHSPGGDGSIEHPGIRWFLEFLRSKFGPYSSG
ncbi:MAG: hypothetical protein SNJ71_00675 [Bacteroidales bacterium]